MSALHVLNDGNDAKAPRRGTRGASGGGAGASVAGFAGEFSRERDAIARELANAIEGEVRFGLHDRMLYATDASLYQVEPLGVVIPANTEDARRAIEFCAARRLPMLPRGGGTSLAGQCTNRAVVLDLSPNCRRIVDFDPIRGEVVVEPGVTVDELNDWLTAAHSSGRRGPSAPVGWFFAPDPATSKHANIGGCIGNNAAGSRSILYGRTSESVLAVDVSLADGTLMRFDAGAALRDPRVGALTENISRLVRENARLIRERYPRTIRRNAGYNLDLILDQLEKPWSISGLEHVNLAGLVCGSEGTLAFTLAARLKLHPKPVAKGLAVLAFSSLDEAIASVVDILATKPSAVELLDDLVVSLAKANNECRRYVELMPSPPAGSLKSVLYVEYFVQQESGLADRFVSLGTVAARHNATMAAYTDQKAMLDAWKLRKSGEPLLHGIPGARKPITFVEDNAVPVDRLAEFVKRLRAIVEAHGTRAAFYAHASVGVLHVRPLLDIHDDADRERMRSIAVAAADLARELGGVMSGEHGDGRVRTPLLERFYGPELMRVMRDVKLAFDPRNLLNPGNIVDASADATNPRPLESMTSALRVKPAAIDVKFPAVTTYFDYDDQHGFDGAVEMCNGAGVCRKKTGGTMCPSYMATLDERHSTRGRGNALRLAITGQLAAAGGGPRWNDADTIQTLDLCLSCKACKTECPSNVDISRLKAEYTAQRFEMNGRPPLKALVFGSVRLLNRLGSLAPGLTNAINRLAPVRAVINTTLELHPDRTLPSFARSLASRWPRAEARGSSDVSAAPSVALFGDCFTMFNEPGIGLGAKRVLEACGYRVQLADAGCCARAKISTGLLPQAIDEADATFARLRPLLIDPDVRAILVAEPSCLSAIKDDWLQLKMRTPIDERRKLAEKAFLIDEFVERFWNGHPRTPRFKDEVAGEPVLLHAHCHQKALWGAESSARLLRRVFGQRLKVLDTGCCGMAGSFGYTRDRYELSMKIGELTLLPAVRAQPDAAVAAPGTSCRHQIHDGASREAKHPIELVAAALAD
jgi:FAD/FMN-containing dehydrogenase/Fe-S oxidoreductase